MLNEFFPIIFFQFETHVGLADLTASTVLDTVSHPPHCLADSETASAF